MKLSKKDLQTLRTQAEEWITENSDTITGDCRRITKDSIPEDLADYIAEGTYSDVDDWVECQLAGCADLVECYTLKELALGKTSPQALITICGSSWEGLRIHIEGIFETEAAAYAYLKETSAYYE